MNVDFQLYSKRGSRKIGFQIVFIECLVDILGYTLSQSMLSGKHSKGVP